jgi:hypothetical protein
MKPKKRKPSQKSRQPRIKILLSFDQLVRGVLAISPEDAKDVREKAAKKKG